MSQRPAGGDQDTHGLPELETGHASHCRRVAAVALEIGARLRLPPEQQETLEQAALLHHHPVEWLGPEAFDRLAGDTLGPGSRLGPLGASSVWVPTPDVQRVLDAFHARPRRSGEAVIVTLAEILELADFFDQRLEAVPYDGRTARQILNELSWMANDGVFNRKLVLALAGLQQVRREDLEDVLRRLPVNSSVALWLLALSSEERSSLRQLEKLASSDPVLAGLLIQAANSAANSPIKPISTISHAIAFIGLETTRQLLTAAAFRPLFASSGLRHLWNHSLEAAELAEQVAKLSSRIDPKEAFLTGLVHDVGRLALARLHPQFTAIYARLLDRGCPPVVAEMLLCDLDHGEAGAEGLRRWAFPEHLVTAVQYHHQPELTDSQMAAMLYLVEFWSSSEEDLPSNTRLRCAFDKVAVSLRELESLDQESARRLCSLLSAA